MIVAINSLKWDIEARLITRKEYGALIRELEATI